MIIYNWWFTYYKWWFIDYLILLGYDLFTGGMDAANMLLRLLGRRPAVRRKPLNYIYIYLYNSRRIITHLCLSLRRQQKFNTRAWREYHNLGSNTAWECPSPEILKGVCSLVSALKIVQLSLSKACFQFSRQVWPKREVNPWIVMTEWHDSCFRYALVSGNQTWLAGKTRTGGFYMVI